MTHDLVLRIQLLERLGYRRQRPLTLISAPAGYGKSILASSWLNASACPGAWISLGARAPKYNLGVQQDFPTALYISWSRNELSINRIFEVMAIRLDFVEKTLLSTPLLCFHALHFIPLLR